MTAPKLVTVDNRRLKTKLAQPGGISRDAAVVQAANGVGAMRQRLLRALKGEIDAVAVLGSSLDDAGLEALTARMRTIYNLAGTYGIEPLQRVAASTIDLIEMMRRHGISNPRAIAVHIQAAKHLGPDRATAAEEAKRLLVGLQTVVASITPAASGRG